MAAVLRTNPLWYEMLRLWIPLWWLRQWMPEKLELKEDAETGEKREAAKPPEESLGEDVSE